MTSSRNERGSGLQGRGLHGSMTVSRSAKTWAKRMISASKAGAACRRA